jgi:hypothetical protein
VPASVASATGVSRGVVLGVRYATATDGSVRTSSEWLDEAAVGSPLPARLGGGFAFVLGDTVYRADDWLGHATPIFRSSRGIAQLFPGLDRLYVRTAAVGGAPATHVAFDARSGALLDLGPWPRDPSVGAYVALDAWRAFALTDIAGVVETHDAGGTWNALALPARIDHLAAVRRDELGGWIDADAGGVIDGVVLSDGSRRARPGPQAAPLATRCWVVTGALEILRVDACSEVRADVPVASTSAEGSGTRSHLEDVIKDGWPLGDGTALVAAAGVLSRVSLADGRVVDSAADAFSRRLARCHAVPLGRPGPAFGFVCGESEGMTALFTFDEAQGRLAPVRSFTTPRTVQTSGAGGWLVHGPCDDRPIARGGATYCVGTPSLPGSSRTLWREVHVDEALPSAIGLALDGRVVRIMWSGKLEDARAVYTDAGGVTQTVRIRVDDANEGLRRFLTRGVWVGPVEERTPGALRGWIDADGGVIGVEVDVDGVLRHGPFVRDLGSFFVAGRYGLGWSRAHKGFETTDGGMTWAHFSAPTPLGPSTVRACGPVGCVANGWLRVGWGERAPELSAGPPSLPVMRASHAERLTLTCTALEPLPRPAPAPTAIQLASFGVFHGAIVQVEPEVDAEREVWPPPPGVTRGDAVVHADVPAPLGALGLGSLGRLYAWGPAAGDWTGLGRWRAGWRSPFASAHASLSSAIAPAPFSDAVAARAELGMGRPFNWRLAVAEDPAHALLIAGRSQKAPELLALDEGGSIVPIHRVDGEPWGTVDAAVRIGSDWYVAVPEDGGHVIEVLRADSQGARLVAKVPRHITTSTVRLARSVDGNQLGVVIDGQPVVDRAVPYRWVVPVDLESGRIAASELLGAADLSDRHDIAPCVDAGGSGWVLETPWNNARVVVDAGSGDATAELNRVLVRLRISSERACLEAMAGATSFDLLSRSVRPRARLDDLDATFPVVAFDDRLVDLRCARARPTKD